LGGPDLDLQPRPALYSIIRPAIQTENFTQWIEEMFRTIVEGAPTRKWVPGLGRFYDMMGWQKGDDEPGLAEYRLG
jgi:hypothetical protein